MMVRTDATPLLMLMRSGVVARKRYPCALQVQMVHTSARSEHRDCRRSHIMNLSHINQDIKPQSCLLGILPLIHEDEDEDEDECVNQEPSCKISTSVSICLCPVLFIVYEMLDANTLTRFV